jgi:redox-sensitive bicupin YhaK (pirin superfamily)
VEDAAAGRHPLRVAVGDLAAPAVAVLVLEHPVDDVSDGLEATVRMPRRALRLARGVLHLAHLVHHDERVEQGEVEYAPGEPKGTPWHPHRGFETVTYIIDGMFEHQDSHGGGGKITNGDTQWMTAGGGILHIEKPPEWLVQAGGLFHGLQLWVNLPRAQKWLEPRYQDLRSGQVGLVTTPDAGALVRVIAGEVAGVAGPGSTYTPMTMLHATVAPTAELRLPWRPDFNALVYVLSGNGTVGADRRPIHMGQSAAFGPGDEIVLSASATQESRSPSMDVVILGGQPIREPVAWAGPFVMNTRDEVVQAFEDYQAGRLGQIPSVHGGLDDGIKSTGE